MGRERMKVWLDDVRDAPPGWVRAFTPEEVIELLQLVKVTELSLDHDLGLDTAESERTGYSVLLWLEAEVGTGRWTCPLPEISVHSGNPVGRDRMERVIRTIHRLHAMAAAKAAGSGPPGANPVTSSRSRRPGAEIEHGFGRTRSSTE